MAPPRKQLIEVALPLAPISEAAAREKSIRHGHPSTLHLWWARRPLAACRSCSQPVAVLITKALIEIPPKFAGRPPVNPDWQKKSPEEKALRSRRLGTRAARETTQHLIHALETEGESAAAELIRKLGGTAEVARDLAYRLYTICKRKKWAAEALAYNGLVIAWPELTKLALQRQGDTQVQGEMFR